MDEYYGYLDDDLCGEVDVAPTSQYGFDSHLVTIVCRIHRYFVRMYWMYNKNYISRCIVVKYISFI